MLTFDFNDNKEKKTIEKQDNTLPDIKLEFKVFPLVQKSNAAIFKDHAEALQIVNKLFDEKYTLDHSGYSCLFDMQTKFEDPRLEFEKFITNLSHI